MRTIKRKVFGTLLAVILLSIVFFSSGLAQAPAPEREELSFEIETMPWVMFHRAIAELFAIQLKEIGINVDLVLVDSAPFYSDVYDDRDFDFYVLTQAGQPYPKVNVGWYHSSLDTSPGGSMSNHFGFHNDTMDQLLDEYSVLPPTEVEEAQEYVKEIQMVWAQNLPNFPTYIIDSAQYLRKEWTGYVRSPGGIFHNYNRWTMINITSTITPEEGHFRMCVSRDADTINPLAAREARSYFVRMLLYDFLIVFSPDFRELVPSLASWDAAPDGQTYTFHIRENATWHDDTPLTSQDVAFTFNYILDNEIPGYYEDLSCIGSIETPDEHTVVFHLAENSFWFLHTLTGVPIIPKHIWEGKEWNWDNSPPIGSGPFKWSTWTSGEYMELSKNEKWWMNGHPRIDTVSLKMIPTEEGRLLSVRKGETDADRYEPFAAPIITTLIKSPELRVVINPSMWFGYVGVNLRRPPLDDLRLRRAIAYAMDHQQYVETGFLGFATPNYCPINEVVFPDWYNPAIEQIVPMSPNVTIANNILDEAGYIDVDNDGIRELPGAVAPRSNWVYYAVGGIIIVVVVLVAAAIMRTRARKKRS